jgi:hypothetical protein
MDNNESSLALRLEAKLEKLTDSIGRLSENLDAKMDRLRVSLEGLVNQSNAENQIALNAQSARISSLEQTVVELKTRQTIALTIAGVVLVPLIGGLVAIAVPHLFGGDSSAAPIEEQNASVK